MRKIFVICKQGKKTDGLLFLKEKKNKNIFWSFSPWFIHAKHFETYDEAEAFLFREDFTSPLEIKSLYINIPKIQPLSYLKKNQENI